MAIILDNADDTEFDYQQYFPTGHFGVVVMTSRTLNSNGMLL
jgi:hypothetical protein